MWTEEGGRLSAVLIDGGLYCPGAHSSPYSLIEWWETAGRKWLAEVKQGNEGA